MAATLTSNQSLNTNLRLAQALLSGKGKFKGTMDMVFNQVDPQRVDELFSISTGMGLLTEVTQNSAYPQAAINEFASKSVTQRTFKKAIPVSMLMKRFDNYNVVSREVSRAGYRMSQTKENLMASILIGSTTTTLTWDGLPLLSASHKIGTSGQTQSNIITGGFSEQTVQDGLVRLHSLKDHDNIMGMYDTLCCVFPPALHNEAYRIFRSEGSPSSANRYTNPLDGKAGIYMTDNQNIELYESSFLSSINGGSDTTAYLMSDKLFHELKYLESIAPKMTFLDASKTQTGGDEYRFDYAAAAVAVDYLGVVGITV